MAILGNRLFVGTLDAALIALDARTGQPLWETQVADTMEGHSITSPPLVVKDKVIVGIAGGEYATRGFIDAYDAATGKRLWRFYTIPGPASSATTPGRATAGRPAAAPTWLTGTLRSRAEHGLLAGRQSRAADSIGRRAESCDNLFSDSVVALDPDTGKRSGTTSSRRTTGTTGIPCRT